LKIDLYLAAICAPTWVIIDEISEGTNFIDQLSKLFAFQVFEEKIEIVLKSKSKITLYQQSSFTWTNQYLE
jgi:hypothetical protein